VYNSFPCSHPGYTSFPRAVCDADVVSSRVGQQGGTTYDLMTSHDPTHVTVTSLGGDVIKSAAIKSELAVSSTCTSSSEHQQQQPMAADYSLSQYVYSNYIPYR